MSNGGEKSGNLRTKNCLWIRSQDIVGYLGNRNSEGNLAVMDGEVNRR